MIRSTQRPSADAPPARPIDFARQLAYKINNSSLAQSLWLLGLRASLGATALSERGTWLITPISRRLNFQLTPNASVDRARVSVCYAFTPTTHFATGFTSVTASLAARWMSATKNSDLEKLGLTGGQP